MVNFLKSVKKNFFFVRSRIYDIYDLISMQPCFMVLNNNNN